MRRLDKLTTELLTSIDVLNTLNGGVVEAKVKLSQHDEYRQIDLLAPSVAQENLKAEIHNNNLTVYYNTPVLSNEKLIQVPKVVYNKQIPYFIDSANIEATYEDDRLVVRLPFNERSEGYHRDITPH